MALWLSLLNIPEYAWMCLYKQDSEWICLGSEICQISENGKVLKMTEFSIWQCYTAFWICLDSVLNVSYVLNKPEFGIWQGSECARVTQGPEYATIWLNIS